MRLLHEGAFCVAYQEEPPLGLCRPVRADAVFAVLLRLQNRPTRADLWSFLIGRTVLRVDARLVSLSLAVDPPDGLKQLDGTVDDSCIHCGCHVHVRAACDGPVRGR